jgi:hypothetical protein
MGNLYPWTDSVKDVCAKVSNAVAGSSGGEKPTELGLFYPGFSDRINGETLFSNFVIRIGDLLQRGVLVSHLFFRDVSKAPVVTRDAPAPRDSEQPVWQTSQAWHKRMMTLSALMTRRQFIRYLLTNAAFYPDDDPQSTSES